jgi:hypothetical protein
MPNLTLKLTQMPSGDANYFGARAIALLARAENAANLLQRKTERFCLAYK